MPRDEPDLNDPMKLVGVVVDCEEGTTYRMAECFIEEFVRMGIDPDRLLKLFRRPAYAAAHRAWLELGEEAVQQLIEAHVAAWRPVRIIDKPRL